MVVVSKKSPSICNFLMEENTTLISRASAVDQSQHLWSNFHSRSRLIFLELLCMQLHKLLITLGLSLIKCFIRSSTYGYFSCSLLFLSYNSLMTILHISLSILRNKTRLFDLNMFRLQCQMSSSAFCSQGESQECYFISQNRNRLAYCQQAKRPLVNITLNH